MKTKHKPSHNQFCATLGCGLTRPMHGVSLGACASFTATSDVTSIVDMESLRSDTIDRARLLDINRAQWAAIQRAKTCLSLALTADSAMFKVHCMAALAHLRGLGEG